MRRRAVFIVSVIMVLITASCIKEKYDMTKLSKDGSFSPTLAIAAIRGDIKFSDIVKAGDTVVFDQNKFVKLIFKKDSVLNLTLNDIYNFGDMVTFTDSYTMGPLSIAGFSKTTNYTLNEIIQFFPLALKNNFIALNDGATHPFPSFSSTSPTEKTLTTITTFENAVLKSGFIDIYVKNNLTAPLNSITVSLYNTVGHTLIGSAVIPAALPGQTQLATINLTDKTVTNSINVAAVLSGSPGNTTPVLINLATSNIQFTVAGRDLLVKSGRVILPSQNISSYSTKDTISFNPGAGIELDEFRITTGSLTYKLQSTTPLAAAINLKLPSSLRNNVPVSENFSVTQGSVLNGSISFNNTWFDMGTDPKQPFNRLPLEYTITVNSSGAMVNFNEADKVQFDMSMKNPVFDYLKGYFGQRVESLASDSIDLGIQDILKKFTGSLTISSPSIKLNYLNSFAVPVKFTMNVTGKRNTQKVNLGLAAIDLLTPAAPAVRDIAGTILIDKNNSNLPALISLPPGEIKFSGSASLNPGVNNGLRNNYVFGNSRFLGNAEVEVPMEFKINNFQFNDTVDNFLKSSATSDSPIKPENFQMMRVDLTAKNGFPLGVSIKMKLYDPVSKKDKATIDATDLLKPATVDGNGKVTASVESITRLEFTREFFSQINKADKIIFQFTLNTTGNGASNVKIYSDYHIDFNAAFVMKPEIKFN